MRVVVTQGQLGFARGARAGVESRDHCPGRPQIDLSRSDGLTAAIGAAQADAVVNAAAYTAVDQAESAPDLPEAINGRGAGPVASGSATLGLPLIHLSTDYVFDGGGERPYREDDGTAPLSAYGHFKLWAERAVTAANPDQMILRTSWVYAPFSKNSVSTMLRLAEIRDEIAVESDRRGVPNYAPDLADGMLCVASNVLAARNERALFGTVHLTAGGETSWAGFASEIFAASKRRGGPGALVRPIASSDYPTRARRPTYSCLDGAWLAAVRGVRLPEWRQSLAICVVVRLLSSAARG